MKANEFIKKYGVAEAKKVLHCMDDASEFTVHMPGDTWDKPTLIDAVGLRRLVESHELVEDYGGLEGAKCYVDSHDLYEAIYDEDGNICDYVSNVDLIDAIADVESCHVD